MSALYEVAIYVHGELEIIGEVHLEPGDFWLIKRTLLTSIMDGLIVWH